MPHCVVDNVFPEPVYAALLRALPPSQVFNGPPHRLELPIPLDLAPSHSRRVWRYMAETVARQAIMPGVLDKFREPLAMWLRQNFSVPEEGLETAANMTTEDGRILLRTRGYVTSPHRDPKWGFITCLIYLARPGDDPAWGTQLYDVVGDVEARTARAYWIDESHCRLVEDVAFLPNRALLFLNSVAAHGARIPEDAPEGLERYVYQFKIGPQRKAIERLLARLPEDRYQAWGDKVSF
jgi:hypothetical protein